MRPVRYARRLPRTLQKLRGLFKPRYPFFDQYRTEQIIKAYCERDEILEHPTALELLTTNVVQKTYAREQVHDGNKWLTWPAIPTSSYKYFSSSVTVNAGQTKKLCELEGRGEVLYFGFLSNYPGWRFKLEYDARVEYDETLLDLRNVLQGSKLSRMGQVTVWDVGTPLYGFAADVRERFTRRAALYFTNPDAANQSIGPVIFWAQLHQVRAVVEAKQSQGLPYVT